MYYQGIIYVFNIANTFGGHLQGIQMTTKKRLCSIKGITEAKVDKIKVLDKNVINFNYI